MIGALRKNPYRYFKYLRKYRSRIVHYHHSRWIQFFVVALSRKRSSKYIITIHAGEIDKHFPQLSSRSKIYRKLTIWALRRFDTVIVVNPTIASFLEERRLHTHVELIPAFIPWQAGTGNVQYNPELIDFLESGIVISASAYAIQFLPDGHELYGLDTLIDAFMTISNHSSDTRLAIFIAERPSSSKAKHHLSSLERRLEEHGLRNRVLIVYGLEFSPALEKSALFIRPTRADGDALSIREAQEAGVPVIATDVVPRPPDVMTFPTGNADRLADEVLRCLGSDRHVGTEKTGSSDSLSSFCFSNDLVSLYRNELGLGPEPSHVTPGVPHD